ncbi:hypothetical protein D3C77_700060 [compost metagenome]
MVVGFHRIRPFILQGIGAYLVQQTDITAFLAVIQQNATAFLGDLFQCGFQLKTAVTAQAEQRITGQTFGMNP